MRKSLLIGGGAIVAIAIVITAIVLSGVIEQEEELVLSNYPKLFEKEVVIVVGENATQMEYEGAVVIAENLHNITGTMPVIKSDTELTEDDKAKYNLILVGGPRTNRALGEVYEMTDATRVTSEYPGENKGILEILTNPWNEDKAMLLVEGSDEWGVKAGVKNIIDTDRRIQDKTFIVDWIEAPSEVIVELPKSIKLKALEAYNLSDSKTSIPKDLYIDSYHLETEGYYIVQFKGPIYEEYKAQVIDLGGKFFDYIPEYAFIVKMNESTKDKVQKLNVIQWIGIYQPAYKISPSLLNKAGNITLTIGVFGGENITNISRKIKSMDGIISMTSEDEIRVLINASTIPEIANIWAVKYIEEYVIPEILDSRFKLEGF